ncbi:MbnP family protein [Polluticaenibacter yanchengensis]|uniref:Copper-binding protein MbnP-like domain-containing protein n=1 Tax=Polluticaenibacter yanchengensis TaxID=3014562 RepID=A0ABT4UP45_9BACT|nr:hypothetical protein [Chitinophagaceae bacterium LY-5]
MKKILIAVLAAATLFTACKKDTEIIDGPGQATIKFDSKVGTSEFELNKEYIIGRNTYSFNKLRYWVSNVILVNANGSEYAVPNSYYLIEETIAVPVQDGAYTYPATKRDDVTISNIPVGEYKALKFSIGVESKYNDNLSLQVGELSQLNGMTNVSWMWHTSYIFSAIGGTINAGLPSKTIKAETGLNTNYKSVTLNLPATVKVGSQTSAKIDLTLDVVKVLDGIDLIATPTIGASQATVMSKLAENYTKSFAVVSGQ